MIPILYDKTATDFNNNGTGRLIDCASCLVTEERNGRYELEIEYPLGGAYQGEIELNSIIGAEANETDQTQLFTVYSITRELGNLTRIRARHISYRLTGIPVKPFTATGASAALAGLITNSVTAPGFTVSTDITSSAEYAQTLPRSFRSCLAGSEDSILDIFGGEYHFDNFRIQLLESRGKDSGVSIRYGKNLTDIKREDDTEGLYNGVYPFWYKEDEGIVYPSAASVGMDYPFANYEVVDMTDLFETRPTAAQLTTEANAQAALLMMPESGIEVSFAALWELREFDLISALEKVALCDTVNVVYDAFGVNLKSKAVKTVYNTLRNRFESVTIGTIKADLPSVLATMAGDIRRIQ